MLISDAKTNMFVPAVHPLSCQAYKNVQAVSRAADIHIDVDGSGPLPAFPVTCEFYCEYSLFILFIYNNKVTIYLAFIM